jgi:polysaccharide biosynthesis/export protein
VQLPRASDQRSTESTSRRCVRGDRSGAMRLFLAAAFALSICPGRVTAQTVVAPLPEPDAPVVTADCLTGCNGAGSIPWEVFAQGEYIGPPRPADVPVYWLRVGDDLEIVYRLTREESSQPYELNVGDRVRVESVNDPMLDRDLLVQPDGMITVRILGQVRAARRTVAELRDELEERYLQYYKVPAITVTPIQVNARLDDLWGAITGHSAQTNNQIQRVRVAPDGTIQLPAVGSVPAQNLTLDELKLEIDERYAQIVSGISVTPRLARRATRYVYVVGEVRQPGRYTLEGPTTVMQAIALAGGWNHDGKLCQIVVYRRAENWGLIATSLDLRRAMRGKSLCPADEIWIRDSDIVLVPKSGITLGR